MRDRVKPERAEHALILRLGVKEQAADPLPPSVAHKLADNRGRGSRALGGRIHRDVLKHAPFKRAGGDERAVILPQGNIKIGGSFHRKAALRQECLNFQEARPGKRRACLDAVH